jgi:hypothetical protein
MADDGPLNALQKMVSIKGRSANFEEYFDNLKEDQTSKDNGMGTFMTAFRLTGEAKVKGSCEFIETLYENGAKFLVFAHHISVLDGI